MRASRILFAILFVVVATLAMWSQARAQDYPARPVTVIVPFAPGGGVDQMARLISGKLEQRLGRSFIIENKPGAGSIIAATHVQKSAPDGYTLLMAPAPTMAVNVSLYKNLPYDPTTDFSLIGLLSGTPFVLMVNVDLPVKSVPELLAYAKANADKMTFASAGPGVPHHLFMELFKSMTGMKASHVPYRGSLPALNDLVAGHIPMMFSDLGPATGLIEGKRVRVLGISTRTRHPSFPDIPPLGEAGVPGYEAVSWQAMAAPAQTPKPVLDKLNSEITAVLAMPEVREQILKYGFLPLQNRSVDELKSFVKSEIVRWGKVVSDAGIAGSQ
ncbi:MAG TPA: tripartite tricarboxylate transporter substrate binding protein [Xanthobacteraceae bacterium]